MTVIVGLTGGIASGKSFVSDYLKSLNYKIIDADRISRQVVEKGSEGLNQIVGCFGSQVIQEDGTLNRPVLNQTVFHDESKRKKLESILHPLILAQMTQEIAQLKTERVIFLDVPLLFEQREFADLCDYTLLIWTDEQTQLERLMARNQWTQVEAMRRIKTQMPLAQKESLADGCINNSGSREQTCAAINVWLDTQLPVLMTSKKSGL